jgi:hypothetical protein
MKTRIERDKISNIYFVDYLVEAQCWKNYASSRDYDKALAYLEELRKNLDTLAPKVEAND